MVLLSTQNKCLNMSDGYENNNKVYAQNLLIFDLWRIMLCILQNLYQNTNWTPTELRYQVKTGIGKVSGLDNAIMMHTWGNEIH